MIGSVLAPVDAERVAATLGRLARAGLGEVAVTGGVAIAGHLAEATGRPAARPLNDLDVVVPDAASVASARLDGFLLAHLHPEAPPGRLLAQVVDPAARLRVDVFGAFGGQFLRSRPVRFGAGTVRVVSAGDLAARLAALILDLGLGETVPAKHARDFLALHGGVEATAGAAWADHRRPRHPATFVEARDAVLDLVRTRPDLLIEKPAFTVGVPCPRCRPVAGRAFAPPRNIAAALGLR